MDEKYFAARRAHQRRMDILHGITLVLALALIGIRIYWAFNL